MDNIKIANEILSAARKTREHFYVTGRDFDKVHANMYSIFECYAHGIIDWNQVKTFWKQSIKEYVSLYKGTSYLKEEIDFMKEEYKNKLKEYKPALDSYKAFAEQKLTKKILNKVEFIGESAAQAQSEKYYNSRMLKESELKDTTTLTWERVMEAYPNLTAKDEQRVRMLTIFESPTVDTTQMITTISEEPTAITGPMQTSIRPKLRPGRYDNPDQWFNPNAGQLDQPEHPQNRGLTDNPSSAPATSPRPRLRPDNLSRSTAINRAVRTAMGEGWKELPPINRDRYQERDGLEGPFSTLSGKVVYYDPKEGSYYDPDTDMYLSYDEFKELDNDYSNMKDERDIDVKESSDAFINLVADANEMADEAGLIGDINYGETEQAHEMFAAGDIKGAAKFIVNSFTGIKNNIDGAKEIYQHLVKSMEAMAGDSVNEEMSDDEIDAFHRALDAVIHKHIGHGSHEKDDVDERKMTKAEKSKEKRLKKKYDDSDMKASMKKQYGDDWEQVYFATIRKQAMEGENKFDGHDIMSEDPPNGIDFDYANLSKVNWAQYSEEDIKTFYSIVDNLSFESGYYNDGEFDDSHFNALQWLEKNVMNKTEAKRRPDHNMQAQMRLQKIMQQAIKDSKKRRGIEDDDEKERTDEMTSAGGIAAVAQPMGKMQRRKKTVEDEKKSPAGGPGCWKGKKIHPTKPTKMKGGKRVNNCIDDGK
jgi:hypothetical protein